jgi:hypothetical protein
MVGSDDPASLVMEYGTGFDDARPWGAAAIDRARELLTAEAQDNGGDTP